MSCTVDYHNNSPVGPRGTVARSKLRKFDGAFLLSVITVPVAVAVEEAEEAEVGLLA